MKQKGSSQFDMWEAAHDEFYNITSMYSGNQWTSSNGYEFKLWMDDAEDHPTPEHPLIEWSVSEDTLNGEDCYAFEMTLPF